MANGQAWKGTIGKKRKKERKKKRLGNTGLKEIPWNRGAEVRDKIIKDSQCRQDGTCCARFLVITLYFSRVQASLRSGWDSRANGIRKSCIVCDFLTPHTEKTRPSRSFRFNIHTYLVRTISFHNDVSIENEENNTTLINFIHRILLRMNTIKNNILCFLSIDKKSGRKKKEVTIKMKER